MKEDRTKYNLINGVVLLITLGIFICIYGNIESVFEDRDIRYILVLLAAVYTVHLIKAGRLYLVLYGTSVFENYFVLVILTKSGLRQGK